MSTSSQVLLALVGVVAVVDWYALVSLNKQLERLAKPLVMVGLFLVVVASDLDGWPLAWLCLGIAAGLAGDILLLPEMNRFVGGLAAFLLGHLAYIGLALWFGTSTFLVVAGLLVMSTLVFTAGTRITDAVRGSALFAPVVTYVVVIGLSTALLIGTGRWLMATGAMLFALSDTLLGWNRFVAPIKADRVAIHVTYHVGQVLIALGAIV